MAMKLWVLPLIELICRMRPRTHPPLRQSANAETFLALSWILGEVLRKIRLRQNPSHMAKYSSKKEECLSN